MREEQRNQRSNKERTKLVCACVCVCVCVYTRLPLLFLLLVPESPESEGVHIESKSRALYVVSLRNMKYDTKDDYFHMLLLLRFDTVAAEVPSKCSRIILCRDAIIQNVMDLEKASNFNIY
jgi:hypothetical protein